MAEREMSPAREVWQGWRRRYTGEDSRAQPFYPTIADWALAYWQVADDEYLPLGDVQDLLGELLRRIELLEGDIPVSVDTPNE